MSQVPLGNMECDTDGRYEVVCKREFENINTKLDKMMNQMFVDNGSESWQSRLNRHDRWIKAVMVVIGVIGVSVVGIIADLIVRHFYQ